MVEITGATNVTEQNVLALEEKFDFRGVDRLIHKVKKSPRVIIREQQVWPFEL